MLKFCVRYHGEHMPYNKIVVPKDGQPIRIK